MSVATELQRIIGAKADLKTAIEAKGVTVSSSALIDAYPALVDAIPSGGGAIEEEKVLNFIDYDGTIIASYENNEIQSLTELPSAPDHSSDEVPLTFDEWNWTLAEIKAYNTSYPNSVIIVGANYHTTDGKTHVYFNITTDNDLNGVYVFLSSSASGTIDWGDGTTETKTSGSEWGHIYSQAGLYHCIIETNHTYISFGGFSDSSMKYYSKVLKIFYPSSVTSFDYQGGNSYCSNLQTISIPKTMTSMSSSFTGILKSCYALKALVVPKGATSISTTAINDCYSLKYVSLPEGITSFGNGAFQYCRSLRQFTIPSSVTNLGLYPFRDDYSLQSITIPNGVTTIGDVMCNNCSSLQRVVISEGVTTLGGDVFAYGKSLQSITIPSSVTSIGSYAFRSAYTLYTVILLPTTPPTLTNSNAFSTSYQKKFYVPYSADHSILNAYKTASNWSTYASYMEELPE